MKDNHITINLINNSYDIIIEKDIISKIYLDLFQYQKVLIVSDDGIPYPYIEKLALKFSNEFYICVIGEREDNKNLKSVEKIIKQLVQYRFSRKDLVIALGGGVVGDTVGFASSIYMRGIDFINVPTTLLSMVDSSIGGKTGINFSNIKNIIGTFYQPKKVYIDVETLKTLDKRLFNEGLIESIKMAITLDREFFEYLEDIIINKKNKNIEKIIIKSLQLKKMIVEKDEKEQGIRKVLNFGHTIGHGIEESCDNQLYHGECVALGMLYMTNNEIYKRLFNIIKSLNINVNTCFDKKKALNIILHDKKSERNYINCVVCNEIGKYEFTKFNKENIQDILNKNLSIC